MMAQRLPQEIIARKRDGHALRAEEIRAFVRGATDGSWADYQLSALLMAITLRGMSVEETVELTRAIVESGVVADLSGVRRPKLDKHSTGGVGDKVSLILAPMVVACGGAVPMVSGRGLGHTGGTLDKLESIAGFRVGLSLEEFRSQVERIGVALIGQTSELAPADKKLYSLRDVTATVECLPLICASIMGKKLAEGNDALVLDVKFGRGAFMKDLKRAHELAEALVTIGRGVNKPVRAVLTAMDEPLGRAVGNALEVRETVECLHGDGPADTMEVCYTLGEQMLLLGRLANSREEARSLLEKTISSGEAFDVFRKVVAAQGGQVDLVDHPERLPQAKLRTEVKASAAGYVQEVDAMEVATAALHLGAGRMRAEDRIDPAVGLSGLVKVGEKVEKGQPVAIIHAQDEPAASEAAERLKKAIAIGPARPARKPLIESIL
jgi:pyrimidine-nucleoside phosphorylase